MPLEYKYLHSDVNQLADVAIPQVIAEELLGMQEAAIFNVRHPLRNKGAGFDPERAEVHMKRNGICVSLRACILPYIQC